MKKMSMLEKHAIISHETLETSSDYPETLTTIELRQYREQALLHISDRRMIMTFCARFVKALLLASTMFADRVVLAGLPFTLVGSNESTHLILQNACKTAF